MSDSFIWDTGKPDWQRRKDALERELDGYRADQSLYRAVKPGKYNQRQIKLLQKRAESGRGEVRREAKDLLEDIARGQRIAEIRNELSQLSSGQGELFMGEDLEEPEDGKTD